MAFIRLKRRQGKKGLSYYAVLVESGRIDGKPRQRVIKHLAAIQEDKQQYQGFRFRFWEKIEDGLTELGYNPGEIDDLTARISETIHRPSQADMARWKQEREEWRQKLKVMFRRSA